MLTDASASAGFGSPEQGAGPSNRAVHLGTSGADTHAKPLSGNGPVPRRGKTLAGIPAPAGRVLAPDPVAGAGGPLSGAGRSAAIHHGASPVHLHRARTARGGVH